MFSHRRLTHFFLDLLDTIVPLAGDNVDTTFNRYNFALFVLELTLLDVSCCLLQASVDRVALDCDSVMVLPMPTASHLVYVINNALTPLVMN
jgi:hypothetical protein